MDEKTGMAQLPPLEWLRVFDAAARTGNFTAAGAELGLTQAAVSQRMRNLEARLGAALFKRLPRGVELTVEGEAYAPHVAASLAALQRSTADLFSASRRKLSIAANASTIDLWLTPRLPALIRALPDLEVSLNSVLRLGDYTPANSDFEVRFGNGVWPGREAKKLFDEVLAPVVSPHLLEKAKADWRQLPQIALAGPRVGWRDWAAACGVAPPRSPSLRYDVFAHALTAAVKGAGVLLASTELTGDLIRSNRLVLLPEPSLRMEDGYWLTWPVEQAMLKDHTVIVETLCGPVS